MENSAPRKRPMMTVADLADYLKVHSSTVYRMLNRGELPSFRIGSDYRFDPDAIDAWIAARSSKGAPSAKT